MGVTIDLVSPATTSDTTASAPGPCILDITEKGTWANKPNTRSAIKEDAPLGVCKSRETAEAENQQQQTRKPTYAERYRATHNG